MSKLSPAARTYRIFVTAAIAHAGFLLASLFFVLGAVWGGWTILWVALTTLWFIWPIILALHAGRSARAAYGALIVAAVVLALPMRAYCSWLAPQVFMPNELVTFSPYDLAPFTFGYIRGWAEAKLRAGMDPIALEGYGMGGDYTPGAPPFTKEALEKYRLRVDAVAMCSVTPYIQGHAKGYNTASVGEIKRRYGGGVITTAEQEEAARQQRSTDLSNAGRSEAERDVRSGRLVVLIHGKAVEGERDYRNMLRDRYGVELRRMGAVTDELDADIWTHVVGYNEVSSAEIRQRFGEDAGIAITWVTSRSSYESLLRRLEFQDSLRAASASQ